MAFVTYGCVAGFFYKDKRMRNEWLTEEYPDDATLEREWREYQEERDRKLNDFDEWESIDSLRLVDRDLSGMHYSMDYAGKRKNRKSWYCEYGGSVGIEEAVYIREAADGKIRYQVVGRNMSENSVMDFTTQFGMFHSEDNGEFGGELITPGGKRIGGHYKWIFDLKDKVYAISSFCHFTIAQTSIDRFDTESDYKCIYTAGYNSYLKKIINGENTDRSESFICEAVDLKDEEAFVAISGLIDNKDINTHINILRLLRIKDGNVEVVKELSGKVPSRINNIIVEGDTLYLSCDKMVCLINLADKGINSGVTYKTCLSPEDEANLLDTESKRGFYQ